MNKEKIIDKLCEVGNINPTSSEDIEKGFEVLEVNDKIKLCRRYLGVHCIDGSCPRAMEEEYADRCMDIVTSCEECPFYYGCVDCGWWGTSICILENKRCIDIELD